MSEVTDPREQVRLDGMRTFEHVEKKLAAAREQPEKLVPVFAAAIEAGIVGTLVGNRWQADARRAAGLVAEAESIVWRLHREGTDACVAAGLEFETEGGPGR